MEGSQFVNITETMLLKQGAGTLLGVTVNSHTSGTLKLVDGFTNGVVATTDLTSSGAMVPADYATSTLTSDTTNVADGETVTINTTVYTFQTTPTNAYDVKIGIDAADSLANLKKAINLTGTQGVEYVAGTAVNPDVIAGTLTATTLQVWARTLGTTPNAYPTTETSAHLSWADTTLGGGTGTSNPGVTAAGATFTIGVNTYTAVIRLAETLGMTSVENQVLWVTSEAVFLDNIKSAINRTGTPGTDYSSATIAHPQVIATTNTNTVQTFKAKKVGTSGNAIATTDTMANYAFTSTVMASGTLTEGRIMHNTITFGATERFVPIPAIGESFATGLLAVVGGTADITFNFK